VSEQEQRQIFETWLEKHKGLLFKIVRAYAFTAMDRDDLFQEVVIQVWRSVPAFRHESAVTTWLYRIALNTAIRWSGRERKHWDNRENLEAADQVLQEATHPDERLKWLYAEIAKLDEIDRSIALLLLEGFSYQEIADITGLTKTNVGVRINRIKSRLTERLPAGRHGSKKVVDYGI